MDFVSNLSAYPFLYTIVHDGHFEIIISLNMHAMNSKSSVKITSLSRHNNYDSLEVLLSSKDDTE
jgi:hypothetical protein